MEILKLSKLGRHLGAIFGGLVCLLAWLAGGPELRAESLRETMANDLWLLPQYVVWPTNTFATPAEPWRIGILGMNPFGDLLETNRRDHQVAGRGFEIWRATQLSNLPPCEIIFIAGQDAAQIKDIVTALGSRPVLTVSEHDNFLALGGMIQFAGRKEVRILIDLDHSRAGRLKISTPLLEIASEVVEHGGWSRSKR
jgi:hypothetical protein